MSTPSLNSGDDDAILTQFNVDDTFMSYFEACMDNYGKNGAGEGEWNNNLISNKFRIYQDGLITKSDSGSVPNHRVSAKELDLCKKVSKELAEGCPWEIEMDSEVGGKFEPFYIAAQLPLHGDPVIPTRITPELIRNKFAGTIFPLATITVEALLPARTWWQAVRANGRGTSRHLEVWLEMLHTFRSHSDISFPVFIQIGDSTHLSQLDEASFPPGTEMTGSVLPRLVMGVTANGSIVGAITHVKHP